MIVINYYKRMKTTKKWCDSKCKHAEWPEKIQDGSGSCHTFIGLYCKKKKRIVYKNWVCNDKEEK